MTAAACRKGGLLNCADLVADTCVIWFVNRYCLEIKFWLYYVYGTSLHFVAVNSALLGHALFLQLLAVLDVISFRAMSSIISDVCSTVGH